METSKLPTNPHVTDPSSLSSRDKVLIGVLVPVGVVASAGAAFIVYSRCFKVSSIAPIEDSDVDLENQNDTLPSEIRESQSSAAENEESIGQNSDVADHNDSVHYVVDETRQ